MYDLAYVHFTYQHCLNNTYELFASSYWMIRYVRRLFSTRYLPIWIFFREGNDPEDYSRLTYKKLTEEVCKFANVLKSKGVAKGDRVAIYMPMILETVTVILACSRIGAVHSIVVRKRIVVRMKIYLWIFISESDRALWLFSCSFCIFFVLINLGKWVPDLRWKSHTPSV